MGDPDPKRICTSDIERQNLTIRMQMRRLTRLTNAFSKKWEHLWAAYCLYFAYYNFCRVHQSLRVTPAMESNLRTTFGIFVSCWPSFGRPHPTLWPLGILSSEGINNTRN